MERMKQWEPIIHQEPGRGERLDSWKEIAAYLNRSVRTAQEWERHEGMPVHRQRHAKRGSVYALRHELDAWRRGRREDLGSEEPAVPILLTPRKRLSRRVTLAAALTAIAVLTGVTGWFLALRSTSRQPLQAIPFTTYPGQEWLPEVSPDGGRVAFLWTGATQDNMDIYVRPIGGPGLTRPTDHPANDWAPAWSPNGEQIAFLRTLTSGVVEMFLIPAAGGSEKKIGEVLGPVGFVEACLLVGPFLTWTSDGRSLIVVDRDSMEEPYAIFALNLDTWNRHRLTQPPPAAIGDSGPALSADGRTLAFHRLVANETSHLFLLELTEDLKPAGKPTQLTFAGQLHTNPVWLEGDREILYTAGPSRETGRLWRLDVSLPSRRSEVVGVGAWGWTPTVSHAARRMIYAEYRSIRNVWRIDLARDADPAGRALAELNSTLFDGTPSWAPDGQRIAVVSDRSGQRAIWLFAADGTRAFQLTRWKAETPRGLLTADPWRSSAATAALTTSAWSTPGADSRQF
jgi:Tol biopolymer transport system component